MNKKPANLLLGVIVGLIVIGSATLEDWYGRTYYAQDALGYLDSYQAIDRGDWRVALTPQWSIGYPLILSATRSMFPSGPQGEWTAIHVVNLIIFLATYLAFLYFLKVAATYTAWVNGAKSSDPEDDGNGYLFLIGTSVFVLWQVIIGNVSRVSPDLPISGVFFLVTATCLDFFMRPSAKTAVILGFFIGLGYVFKAGFLPASVLTFLIVLLHTWIYSAGNRVAVLSKLAWALPVIALVALPYAAALSSAVGKFTFGESGSINYAWHVNHLPANCNWQGGTPPFGTPIHPTHLVLNNPPVFIFAEPFPVTYAPWYNIPYFYEGYHHFFSLRNQLSAIKTNLSEFRKFFIGGDHAGAKGLVAVILLAGALFLLKQRQVWWKRLAASWPLYLLTIVPIGVYVLVHIEPRYVIGPMIALVVIPFLPLFVPKPLISRRAASGLAIFLVLGCAGITVANRMDVVHQVCSHKTYLDDGAWKAGLYLHQMGVQPGDKIAAVGPGSSLDDTWAYVCGAHIVGEIGNFAYDPDNQKQDLQLFAGSPEVQETVFNLFRQAGAEVVVARYLDGTPQGDGWEKVPDSPFWVHRL
jgi:hypothetical protein